MLHFFFFYVLNILTLNSNLPQISAFTAEPNNVLKYTFLIVKVFSIQQEGKPLNGSSPWSNGTGVLTVAWTRLWVWVCKGECESQHKADSMFPQKKTLCPLDLPCGNFASAHAVKSYKQMWCYLFPPHHKLSIEAFPGLTMMSPLEIERWWDCHK